MPVMRMRPLLLLAALPSLLAAGPSDFGASFNSYSGSGGVHVITPSVHGSAELDPRTQLAVQADVDSVSAASFNYSQSKTHRGIRGVGTCWTCHPPTDALSGATRNYLEVRRGAELSVKRVQGPLDLSAAYLINRENDYASDGARLKAEYSSPSVNTRLSLSLNALFDRISPVTRSFEDELRTLGADLSWTQILSPRTLGLLTWSAADAEGYQSNPYAFVQIGALDTAPQRVLQPREKLRQTGRLSLRQGLWSGSAVEGGLRYYQDSWDVRSLTYELSLAQRLGPWVLEPLARYQDQSSGAYFFKDHYLSAQEFMTRDLKLAPHRSLSVGVGLRADLGDWSVESRWTRYQRQDSLDYSLYAEDGPEQADLFQVSVTLQ